MDSQALLLACGSSPFNRQRTRGEPSPCFLPKLFFSARGLQVQTPLPLGVASENRDAAKKVTLAVCGIHQECRVHSFPCPDEIRFSTRGLEAVLVAGFQFFRLVGDAQHG